MLVISVAFFQTFHTFVLCQVSVFSLNIQSNYTKIKLYIEIYHVPQFFMFFPFCKILDNFQIHFNYFTFKITFLLSYLEF